MTKRKAKREYLAKRRRRVRELYVDFGLTSRQIAEKLVSAGVIETTDESLESAIRLVRSDVAEIRREVDAERDEDGKREVAGSAGDALRRQLERLRYSYEKQREIADDESIVTSTMTTPNGVIVTEKPKWPPGVRQKAAKDAVLIAKEISQLETELATKSEVATTAAGAKSQVPPFRMVFSGRPLEDLIRDRTKTGEVN